MLLLEDGWYYGKNDPNIHRIQGKEHEIICSFWWAALMCITVTL
jgi:hypothetical protein